MDFSRDSIDVFMGHSKKTSKKRILILHRNFSQTAADSRCFEPDARGQHRLSKISVKIHNK